MSVHESCESGLVLPRSCFRFRLVSLVITGTAVSSAGRSSSLGIYASKPSTQRLGRPRFGSLLRWFIAAVCRRVGVISIPSGTGARALCPGTPALFGQASRRSPANDSTVVLGNCPFLGYPEQGLTCIGAAIAEGPKLSHPPSLATALGLGCKLLPFDRDNEVLEEWVGEMVAIITDQALPHRRAGTTIYCGWRKSKMAM
jgi:hypothetical protein